MAFKINYFLLPTFHAPVYRVPEVVSSCGALFGLLLIHRCRLDLCSFSVRLGCVVEGSLDFRKCGLMTGPARILCGCYLWKTITPTTRHQTRKSRTMYIYDKFGFVWSILLSHLTRLCAIPLSCKLVLSKALIGIQQETDLDSRLQVEWLDSLPPSRQVRVASTFPSILLSSM